MKATKKELSGEKETRLSEELFLPALDAQLFTAREFFLRCFGPFRCHHLDVFALSARAIADVCVTKANTFFFSKRSARYYELLAFD
jgi:hypothetical protein